MKLQTAPPIEPKQAPHIEVVRDEELLSDKPWHVVLLDDDQHTYDYVIEMLFTLFKYPLQKCIAMTIEVDTKKRVIVKTCHLEQAEFHQERIHNYGPDPLILTCRGSMRAVLEQSL